jgi:hypothetical protein
LEGSLENKGTRTGWLEKVFRAGQDPQRIVVPLIIVIGRTVWAGDRFLAKAVV